MELNIHSMLYHSKANGPGTRAVIWFQGCALQCKGCFNPLTHSFEKNILMKPETLAQEIFTFSNEIEGITISGGEPFEQHKGLSKFLQIIRLQSQLSVIVFSGYTIEQINKNFNSVLKYLDVLIAGPYIEKERQATNLAGSANKTFHFLTERYTKHDFENIPDAEILIDSNGNITASGITSKGVESILNRQNITNE
jgi:anaerobic ribonucleoside-triphosphate reductase activating protein